MSHQKISRLRLLINAGALRQTCKRVELGWSEFDMADRLAFDYPGYVWAEYLEVVALAQLGVERTQAALTADREHFATKPNAPILPA
jgi:hypothetical protein